MPGGGTTNFFVPTRLMTAPTKRAAYSDRTAWIMASLSELAYKMFETEGTGPLEEKLSAGGFNLIQTVNAVDGKAVDTQAILVNKPGVMSVLAFRGTEFKFNQCGPQSWQNSPFRPGYQTCCCRPFHSLSFTVCTTLKPSRLGGPR